MAATLFAHDFLPGCNDGRVRSGETREGSGRPWACRRKICGCSQSSGSVGGCNREALCDCAAEMGHDMKLGQAWYATLPSLVVMAGLMAACDARQWPLAEYRSGKPAAQAWLRPQEPMSAPGKQADPKPAPSKSAPKGVETASVAMPGPASTVKSSDVLIGLDMEQARKQLGPPQQEVERAPAKLWLYRTPQCSLDVALYPDVQTQVFRVLNYEVNSNDGTEQGRRQCIASLRSGAIRR
ncbi:MAG: hypothetical protein VW600_05180 [Ferrovibrio sp.]